MSHPGEFWLRATFNTDEPWQKVCILKGRGKQAPPKEFDVSILYPEGHPINPKKIADLQKVIPYLPPSCREFYRSLADHPVEETDDD